MSTLTIGLSSHGGAKFTLDPHWIRQTFPQSMLASALEDPDVTQLDIINPVVTPEVMTVLVGLAEGKEPLKHVPSLVGAHRYLNVPELLPYADPCYDVVAACSDWKHLQNSDVMEGIIRDGRMPLYRYLVRRGYMPVAADLVTAATHGNYNLTQELLTAGMDPTIINTTKYIWPKLVRYPNILQLLLAHPSVNPGSQNNAAIKQAAELGEVDSVRLLLAEPKGRINPTDGLGYDDPLILAARNGHLAVVCMLVADPRVNPAANEYGYGNNPLRVAAFGGHIDVVKVLLEWERHYTQDMLRYVFLLACSGGSSEVVQSLVDTGRVIVSYDRNDGLVEACSRGHISVVRLLMHHKDIDPSYYANGPLHAAASAGHLDVVRLLLTDKRANTTIAKNIALAKAAFRGHLPVMRYLLTEEGADPTAYANEAFIWAASGGKFEAMQVLLEDKRVNPGDRKGEAIKNAAINGHIQIVEFLLAHPQVAVAKCDFTDLVARKDRAMMKLLLSSPKVDPVDWNNSVVNWAGAIGDIEFLRLLINNPFVPASITPERLAHFRKICAEAP